MDTKDEIAERINDKLGTRIQWEKMTKDDLSHFEELIDDGMLLRPMLEEVAKEEGKKKFEEMIDEWEAGTLIEKVI